ncbi:MAG: PQQ-dependent sugar dehydrogenase, partial [Anaerolineae bacterium]|nr:PQQ-dependent sugar dehydrogenase [Anaerolineae bacterium]
VMLVGIISAGLVQAQDAVRTAAPDGSQYQLVEVASGLVRPVFLTHAGDGSGRMFIVEQNGRIWVMKDGSLLATPFLDVSKIISRDASERGLLGLAFHPDFEQNGQFFINYTDIGGDTAVARYTVSTDNPDAAAPDSAEIILSIHQPYANHNGGDIAFGPDGYLYIGMGDGGSAGDPQGNGQNPAALLGKILRVAVNGTDGEQSYVIPADNPYVNNAELAPEVWAMGLRNPWRFSFDRATGDLYVADVGQNQYEEVNFQPAGSTGGENYGWNITEGTHQYSGAPIPEGLTNPFFEYRHSDGGCSVTGGYVYRGEVLTDLQGVYLFGDYCSGTVWASYRDAAGAWQTNVFMETSYRISSFGEDESGEVYLIDHGGSVLRFTAAGG